MRLEALTQRIVFDKDQATGVELASGEKLFASCEVLLCAGAYNSPQLLMLSGIGPAKVLQQFNIPAVIVREQVGQNLQDHAGPPMAWQLKNNQDSLNARLGVLGLLGSAFRYLFTRKGLLATPAAAVGIFARSNPQATRPDLQFHCLALSGPDSDDDPEIKPDKFPGFTMMPYLMHPQSRGSVSLRTNACGDDPQVITNYFDCKSDLEAVISGMKLANQLAATNPLASAIQARVRPLPEVCDEGLAEYARAHAHTGYHPVGTCRMGADSNAVVDTELRVQGIRGLRVIDASIMPTVISGNTNASVIMIAEKAADMIITHMDDANLASQGLDSV